MHFSNKCLILYSTFIVPNEINDLFTCITRPSGSMQGPNTESTNCYPCLFIALNSFSYK